MIRNIVYKSNNLIVKQLQEENHNNIAVIFCNGYCFVEKNKTFKNFIFHQLNKIFGYGDCTIFNIYYVATGEGLEIAVDELAKFINEKLMLYKKIILHGYSEYGLHFLHLYHKKLNTWAKLRTHVISVAAPIKDILLKDLLEDRSTYNYEYKNNIHIIVCKPYNSKLVVLLFGNKMFPEDQIPEDATYEEIKAFNDISAIYISCKFVKALI